MPGSLFVRIGAVVASLASATGVLRPAFGMDWPALAAVCTTFDTEPMRQIAETGAPKTLGPEHMPLLRALVAARQACGGAVMIEAMRSFDEDPRFRQTPKEE